MTVLFTLLFSVSLLAVLAESIEKRNAVMQNGYYYERIYSGRKLVSLFMVYVITAILSLFSGLRTDHNDTYNYIKGFIEKIPPSLYNLESISFSITDNPGFSLYQVFIKHFISVDPQAFLFISALLTNALFVFFFYKHSPKFSLTIFLYIASGLYIFGMAGMKQMLAMAIGLWAVHYALKGRWVVFALLLLAASTIHPYILFFAAAPVLKDKVWSLRETFILFAITVGIVYAESFIRFISEVHSALLEDLGFELFAGTRINPFRLLVYSIAPFLSFIFRHKLRSINDSMLTISINFSIISFAFMLISLWGNPIYLSRMAIYFAPFSILALTYIIMNCFHKAQRLVIIVVCVISYSIYFYYQYFIIMPFVYRSILGTF